MTIWLTLDRTILHKPIEYKMQIRRNSNMYRNKFPKITTYVLILEYMIGFGIVVYSCFGKIFVLNIYNIYVYAY